MSRNTIHAHRFRVFFYLYNEELVLVDDMGGLEDTE